MLIALAPIGLMTVPVAIRRGVPFNRSAGLIAPSRVVINAVGRVGDHKVRRDDGIHFKALAPSGAARDVTVGGIAPRRRVQRRRTLDSKFVAGDCR